MDTFAFFVRAAIGGLFWWIVLIGACFGIASLRRKAIRTRGTEPAPAM